MALTRTNVTFEYQSSSGSQTYYFTVQQDGAGNQSVKNIRGPLGLIQDPFTQLPQSVVQDIQTGMSQVEDALASSASSGTIAFVEEASKAVSFVTPMANATYRVYFEIPEFVGYRVASKTTTGFTLELTSNWTGTARFDVFA